MKAKLLALGASLIIGICSNVAAFAQGGIEIKDVWARATPGGAQTAAAYATVEAPSGDRLTGASTPVAQKAEIHSMTMDNGVMKMRPVEGLDLPAGQQVTLKPGGYHIMLTGLTKPLEAGQSFPLTLDFAKAGAKQVTVTIEKVGSMGPNAQTGADHTGSGSTPGMSMPMHR